MREYSERIPKPLVTIGGRPIIWYLMKYYAYYGHTEFILCLGHMGDMIRKFFVEYRPYENEDFILEKGTPKLTDTSNATDVSDWNIRFVDTGLHSNIGQRLAAVQEFVDGESTFLANYSDQLSNLPLNEFLKRFEISDANAGFVSVTPSQSFHIIDHKDGVVNSVHSVEDSHVLVNGGYMALKSSIFEYMQSGEELVLEPFSRLIDEKKLFTYEYRGFWKAMDTFKDKQNFDEMYNKGDRPWEVWNGE